MSDTERIEIAQKLGAVRERIIELLTVYPRISPTMMQGGLGPQIRASVWRRALQDLIDEGRVELIMEVHGNKSYRVIQFVQD